MAIARPLSQTLGTPRSVQGISFNAGTDLYFGLDDRLSLCVIPDDQTIHGVPCARGLVHFHPSGEVAQTTLARDLEVRSIRFCRGTVLSWNEDGTVAAHLCEDHVIGSVTVPRGASVRITEDGAIESWSRRLVGEEIIAGVPCQAGSVVTRYGDGRPERLTAASDVLVDGLVALGGSDVEFHRNGRLSRVTLADAAERAGVRFDAGTTLVYREDGTLSLAHLADELTIAGITYPAGTYLQFDEQQALASHATITWSVLPGAQG
ncbi:MAG: hypothetical protein EP329_24240 [Deltaproteobacteria bacterium]|nr:MAG: hypothetical protein EP329_24240 [Deltaproteobacteria bacterium]